ncbi:MAG TPA: hypothetical protein VK559_13340 [Ferruginibacter sp.]|nr:hypothetical protein [Ferruginibacter sp.]
MRVYLLTVLLTLTIVTLSLVFFTKIALIVLAFTTCSLLALLKFSPLKDNAEVRTMPSVKGKTIYKEKQFTA